MSRAIMQSTQVCVSLSLNVIATNGEDTRLATFPILYLTTLIMALWSFGNLIHRLRYEAKAMGHELVRVLAGMIYLPLVFGCG